MALKCAGPQTHIAIMSGMDRTRSYLCLTLSSVLRDALPCAATVTVFTSAARPFAACPELARAVEVERAPAGIRPIQFYEVVILRTLARAASKLLRRTGTYSPAAPMRGGPDERTRLAACATHAHV